MEIEQNLSFVTSVLGSLVYIRCLLNYVRCLNKKYVSMCLALKYKYILYFFVYKAHTIIYI